jgi:putative isomerase
MESQTNTYVTLIRKSIFAGYSGMYREAGGGLPYPFLTPGSDQYADVLWDWDSWLSNVALKQILVETGDENEIKRARQYEQGCVLNWLHIAKNNGWGGCKGWIPIFVGRGGVKEPDDLYSRNMHKPCLAQHAAFLVQKDNGNAEWIRENLMYVQYFVNNYRNHHRHECGLYFWQDDSAIGVDNDPCTFGRPPRSSGSIYLNCLMYKELLALVYLLNRAGLDEIASEYQKDADDLKSAIQRCCWDERDGFYYSVDLNLVPPNKEKWAMHSGQTRDWLFLIQRIGVWSGFLALWAEIATKEQAKRIVEEHYRNKSTFCAPYGVRSLSKMEKMYNLRASGNPSSWLGPIWGISNYMTFRGLVKYGFVDDARDLAEKTILMFGKDLERSGALHEYYQPENGMPILNHGFQNWNYLVLNMIAWLEGKKPVEEF